ncbi:MAG: hypothetical protein K2I69_01875 [Muribaculaceae bacterium]|nr:hypothetical protein [Muribaculaceae bacterium]
MIKRILNSLKGKARKPAQFFAAASVALTLGACQTIDDNRVPYAPVNLSFNTMADWNVYGISGALDYRSFIRDKRLPANYPYTASAYTGFGGVLLVGDVLGEPVAYDLACPVECKKDVRVVIDTEDMLARCPQCGSSYNVFSLRGHPVSGPAAQNGYGLRTYHVTVRTAGTPYALITY